jgi:transposase
VTSTTEAGLVAGIDPHKRTLTVALLDDRGGVVDTRTFKVSGHGHRAMLGWAAQHGHVVTWGVEGASGLGRHTAVFLGQAGADVRDVCPTRTAQQARRRRQGKTDNLDAERIARETRAHPDLPAAFKQAAGKVGPDPVHDQMALLHKARRSLLKTRQHLLNEAEAILIALPEALQVDLGDTRDVRRRLNALPELDRAHIDDPVVALRLRLLDQTAADVAELDTRDKTITAELAQLVAQQASTLDDLVGLSTKSAVEVLVETGDPTRFTEGGYARFNGTAPIPASSGEGDDEPKRHRLDRGGNRQLNAVLHRMAITQLRCNPAARDLYDRARARGHTKREAMRILKRHLSNIVYRTMLQDAHRRQQQRLLQQAT